MLNMKIGEGKASNQFPAGLRVLVVDDDPTCLIITEKMLRGCFYEVTTCSQATVALSLLRERKQAFDIVLSDVHMPDMDGFKLLECIGLEMDLPVIMMSVDDKQDVVMKGITHGACDYLLKPLRLEAVKTIWQHVVRKKRKGLKELEQLGGVDDASRKTCVDAADHSSSINEGSWRNSKRRKEEEDETEERDETSALKKQRVVWSVELHQQFVTAVNQLGIEKAVPKKILELMNVPGLTRENVASHLQKYRLYLKRINGGSQHHIGLNTSFMYPQENFDPSSLNGLDIQALAVSKIPRQCLPSPCGGILNQRDLFAVEAMKLEIAAQQQQQISGTNENVDLIRGPPSIIKSKQLHHLQQRVLSLGSPNLPVDERAHDTLGTSSSTCLDTLGGCTRTSSLMMDMVQSRLRGQVLNGPTDNSSRIPLSTGFHQIQSNKIMDSFAERNACALHGQHGAYNPIPISSSLIEDYGIVDLPGNAFPLVNSTLDLPIHHSTDMVLDGRLELKESRGLTGGYEFRNVDLTFDTSRPSGFMQKCNVECFPSVLCHQGLKQGETESACIASSKSVVPSTEENEQQTFEASALQCDNLPVSANSSGVKGEKLPDLTRENMIFTQHFGQDDLMNSIFMQQEGIAPVDNEFKF